MTSFRNRGDHVEQREEFSHNKISIEMGGAGVLLVAFCIVLFGSMVIWLVINFGGLLALSLLALWITAVVGALIWGGFYLFTRIDILFSERTRARASARVVFATDHYIVWKEEDGTYQFRGSTIITENRQYLPREVSPPSQQEAILTCYDRGMSGRAIEKHLNATADGDKRAKVSYREIAKTLDLYRPDWNKKAVVEADSPKDEV